MNEVASALVAILAVIWFIWRWRRTSVFSNLGIPGPKPNLIFGNFIELYTKGPLQCHDEWVKKYGNVLGYFHGMQPILLVADPQLLKNIYITDSKKFINREPFSPLTNPLAKDEKLNSVIFVRGQKWKEMRSVVTAAYSTAKIKKMSFIMSSTIDFMMEILKKKSETGEIFDIHDTFRRLTLDAILKTSFGISVDVQTNPKSPILRSATVFFSAPYRDFFVLVGLSFPLFRRAASEFQLFCSRYYNMGASPHKSLYGKLRKIIQHRRKQTEVHAPDVLQLMIDAQISRNPDIDLKKLEAGDTQEVEEAEVNKVSKKATRNMSDNEIIANSFGVLIAGYETTGTSLAFTTYLLAKHPHIQERIFEEVEELVQNGEKLDYETIHRLQYLEKVVNESLRLYPPVVFFTNRFASETIRYGSLTIPEGMIIQAPNYLLHHDPDNWPDPETFDPDRFDTKPNSNGIIYLPFGIGPRNCLGMRFAQMEIKLALANIIYSYKIQLSADQLNELPLLILVRTLVPRDGVKVTLESRKKDCATF